MATQIYSFGYLGFEQQMDTHIKTKIIFAVTDAKKTKLAWYLFTQDLLLPRWQADFDLAGIGEKKLDRNEIFGEYRYSTTAPTESNGVVDITKLAGKLSGRASLDMHDDDVTESTACILFVDSYGAHGVLLYFELGQVSKRRTFDIRKPGRIYLLGTEKFSLKALSEGPPKRTPVGDPYNPIM